VVIESAQEWERFLGSEESKALLSVASCSYIASMDVCSRARLPVPGLAKGTSQSVTLVAGVQPKLVCACHHVDEMPRGISISCAPITSLAASHRILTRYRLGLSDARALIMFLQGR